MALATVALWVRWQNNKPVDYRQRMPGRRLPERDELGHHDEDVWEVNRKGEPIDPWRNTRLVYLVDPQTAEAFTFSTSSAGGRGAVADLGDAITRMRTVHRDAVPLVELQAAEMPTKFGRKSKPVLKIVGWKTSDGGDGPAPSSGRSRRSRPSAKSPSAKWTTKFRFEPGTYAGELRDDARATAGQASHQPRKHRARGSRHHLPAVLSHALLQRRATSVSACTSTAKGACLAV